MVSVLPEEGRRCPGRDRSSSWAPRSTASWAVSSRAALKVGLLGAYVGRGLMLVLASFVIQNDFLKFLGAAYLIKLAFENLGAPEPGETGEHGQNLEGKGFWSVVLAVELADLAFSLDNVVAVIALSSDLMIVMLRRGHGHHHHALRRRHLHLDDRQGAISQARRLHGGLQHRRRADARRVRSTFTSIPSLKFAISALTLIALHRLRPRQAPAHPPADLRLGGPGHGQRQRAARLGAGAAGRGASRSSSRRCSSSSARWPGCFPSTTTPRTRKP